MKPKRKHTVPAHNRGKGKAYEWLLDHLDYDGNECLTWPFCIIPVGYGQLGYLGKQRYAHRVMCELKNGPPPTPKHEAAHSCGNGHNACTHPKHLSWKTKAQNRGDCAGHGTDARNFHGNKGQLTSDQVNQIRVMKGTARQEDIAKQFGISPQSVSMIMRGKMYAGSKIRHWSNDEDALLRRSLGLGQSFPDVAIQLGRPQGSVSARAYRLGLKSGRERLAPAARS